LFLSPEGAAATAAYEQLLSEGELTPEETVVLFNTGAGLKYTDMTADAMKLRRPGTLPSSMPVGGIITPV
jgi:threonine synthase